MLQRQNAEGEPARVTESVAARLLARASELDVAYKRGTSLDELKAAALEAGISAVAFDAALAELRREEAQKNAAAPLPRTRRGVKWALAAMAGVLFFGSYVVPRSEAVAEAAAPLREEAVMVRCLSLPEATRLIRPILVYKENKVTYAPADLTDRIWVRGTDEQLRRIRGLLDAYGARPSCELREREVR